MEAGPSGRTSLSGFVQPVDLQDAQGFVGTLVRKGAGSRAVLGELSNPIRTAGRRVGGQTPAVVYTVTYAFLRL